MTTTWGTQEPEPEPARERSALRLFVVAVGCGVASIVCLAGGIFGFAADGTREGDLQRVEVPGSGTFEVEEAGSFTIFYESTAYVDEGVCERRTRRVNDTTRTELVCDEDLLAAAAPPPVIRPQGGDSIQVVDPGGTLAAFDLDQHLPVWAFEATEPGTYEIELDDAPLGTEFVAVGRDGDGAPLWAVGLLIAFLVLAPVSFGVFVWALVRLALSGRSRRATGGPPPPPPSTTAWAPPTGSSEAAGPGPGTGSTPPPGQAF